MTGRWSDSLSALVITWYPVIVVAGRVV